MGGQFATFKYRVGAPEVSVVVYNTGCPIFNTLPLGNFVSVQVVKFNQSLCTYRVFQITKQTFIRYILQ